MYIYILYNKLYNPDPVPLNTPRLRPSIEEDGWKHVTPLPIGLHLWKGTMLTFNTKVLSYWGGGW